MEMAVLTVAEVGRVGIDGGHLSFVDRSNDKEVDRGRLRHGGV